MKRPAALRKKERGPADGAATASRDEAPAGITPLSGTTGDVAGSGGSASPTNLHWVSDKVALGAAARDAGPDQGEHGAVLLPYQQDLLRAMAENRVVVCEKSRRIGATWGVAADAALAAGATRQARGMDVFYIGFNRDMTREFIDTCGMWAREFSFAAGAVEEFLFREQGEEGADKAIQAFRIRFASGFEIVALSSRPRSLRGRQGYVIIDEAAFHDELEEVMKAALALLLWGGKVLVISTHDGSENPFAQLVNDCRTGKAPYKVLRVAFDDALDQGLYQRVCKVTGATWSPEAEAAWAAEIRLFYRDAASEELDCIPRNSGGKYLARTLLEARAADVPVVRLTLDDAFVDLAEEERWRRIADFCKDELAPVMPTKATRSALGEDFGRTGDLTVMWPLVIETDLRRRTAFVLELRNVPFTSQSQILFWICDHLPNFGGAALDARGNGQFLAEAARQRYGPEAIAEVMLSVPWYREHMPRLKATLEDGDVDLPRDADIIDDLRSLEVVDGVARAPERSRQAVSGQRHADAAVALALALFAAATLDAGGPIEATADGSYTSAEAFAGNLGRSNLTGWTLP